MTQHDFKCFTCKTVVEVCLDSGAQIPPDGSIGCQCGGTYVRAWLKSPGIAPDIAPGYDVQLGRYISTRQERDAILKEKGLIALGPDEARWTESQGHNPEPAWDSEGFRDVCEKTWNQVINKEIPPVEAEALPDDVAGSATIV